MKTTAAEEMFYFLDNKEEVSERRVSEKQTRAEESCRTCETGRMALVYACMCECDFDFVVCLWVDV